MSFTVFNVVDADEKFWILQLILEQIKTFGTIGAEWKRHKVREVLMAVKFWMHISKILIWMP